MGKKYVYRFEEGNADMRELLGGKGANLAEMSRMGFPVPPGFTVTTEACTKYYEDGKTIAPDDDNGVSADGQEHVHTISVDESAVTYSPRILLRDVYLVRENRMVTYAVETQQILRDEPWDGPEGTPRESR